jgi:hypothetical protein
MGLDVFAISKIKKSNEEESEINVWTDQFDRTGSLEAGSYDRTNESVEHHFRAGSYSTYNSFRNILSRAIYGHPASAIWENNDAYEGRPFFEIIEFSDCDGCFGPEDSEKLYNDFVTHRKTVIKYCLDNFISDDETYDWIMGTYDNFTKAFEISKDGGVLQFC